MLFVRGRRVVPIAVLVAVLGLLPLAPPAHVHDTVDEAGHHGLLAHQHADTHGPVDVVVHAAGREPVHIEDAESVVATLDAVFVAPASPDLAAPALVAAVRIGPGRSSHPVAPTPYVERQIHGPPRALSLTRGPPVLS